MPPGAVVSFYTLTGEFVNQATEKGGVALWDGRNKNGVFVSPGIYYFVAASGGQTVRKGKFLVTKSS